MVKGVVSVFRDGDMVDAYEQISETIHELFLIYCEHFSGVSPSALWIEDGSEKQLLAISDERFAVGSHPQRQPGEILVGYVETDDDFDMIILKTKRKGFNSEGQMMPVFAKSEHAIPYCRKGCCIDVVGMAIIDIPPNYKEILKNDIDLSKQTGGIIDDIVF